MLKKRCVYLVYNEVVNLYKIGWSRNPRSRCQGLNCVLKGCRLLCYWEGCSAGIELRLQMFFSEKQNDLRSIDPRLTAEWFDLSREDLKTALDLMANFSLVVNK